MCRGARLDTVTSEGSATVSATTAQKMPDKVLPHVAEEPCTFMRLELGDMPQIPMPVPNHPAGEQVHPWED